MMECTDTRGLSQEKNYHREKENPAPNLQGIMSMPKMFPSCFFPFSLQEEPRNMFPGSSHRTAH